LGFLFICFLLSALSFLLISANTGEGWIDDDHSGNFESRDCHCVFLLVFFFFLQIAGLLSAKLHKYELLGRSNIIIAKTINSLKGLVIF